MADPDRIDKLGSIGIISWSIIRQQVYSIGSMDHALPLNARSIDHPDLG